MGGIIKLKKGETIEVPSFGLIRIPSTSRFESTAFISYGSQKESSVAAIDLLDSRRRISGIYGEVEMLERGKIRMPLRKYADIVNALGISEGLEMGIEATKGSEPIAEIEWQGRFTVPSGWDVEMMEAAESSRGQSVTNVEGIDMTRPKPTKEDWDKASALLDRIAKAKGKPTEDQRIEAQRESSRRLAREIAALRATDLRS